MFVINKLSDKQEISLFLKLSGLKKTDIGGRMNYNGLPSVNPADPFRDETAVGNEMIHRLRRTQIVTPQTVFEQRHCELSGETGSPVIVVVHIPEITHRGMAITDMNCSGWFPDPFCRTGFTGNDQIIAAEIQPAQRRRHQRQILLAVVPRSGKPCNSRFNDPVR